MAAERGGWPRDRDAMCDILKRMSIRDKVLETVKKFDMVRRGEKVLVAVSGGPDSIALLRLMLDLSKELGIILHAFHLDHRLRPESEGDAAFVAAVCERLGVQLESASYDVPSFLRETGLSVEDGARRVRYRLLEETADRIGAHRIALGHQADDQVETFLMRLIRGTGLAGLSAIPPVRGRFIRPLIEVDKDEILEYLDEVGEGFVIDASNEDLSFLRNRIRLRLIPELLGYNPAFKRLVLQTVEIAREDEALLETETSWRFEAISSVEDGIVSISLADFNKQPPAIARRIVRRALEIAKGDLLGFEFKHASEVLNGAAAGSLRVDLPGEVVAAVEAGELVIGRKSAMMPPPAKPVELPVPGIAKAPELGCIVKAEVVSAEGYEISKDPFVAQLDAERVKSPLAVRSWRPGDAFAPLGMYGEKKLQDFFVDEKVPRRRRPRIPIVEGGGEILWVVGMRINDRYKVTSGTRKVLILKAETAD